VRQALGILEGMGIIKITPRNGAHVRQPNFADAVEPLAQALYFERDQVNHLFEVRQIIETQTAALAAQRRSDDDIRRLRKLNRQFEGDLQSGDLAFEANKNFHIGIVETAKNPLLIGVITTILVATMEVYVSARHQSLSEKRDLSQFVVEHEQIIEAIAQQDPELTAQLVTKHINAARTRVEMIMEQQQ
jgi:GntR family transcriptional repressor for pyruvate dehydrogenase complex